MDHVVLSFKDVTAELELRERIQQLETEAGVAAARHAAETRFHKLVESAPDAMVIVDNEGTHCPDQRPDREPVRLSTPRVGRSEDGSAGAAAFSAQGILVTGRATSREPRPRPMGSGLELFGLRRDGSEFPVEISLSPIETAEGILVRVQSVTSPSASGRRRSSAACWSSAPDAMVIVNRYGSIVLVNAQTEKLFGYPRAGVVGPDDPAEARSGALPCQASERTARTFYAEPRVRPWEGGWSSNGLRKDAKGVSHRDQLEPRWRPKREPSSPARSATSRSGRRPRTDSRGCSNRPPTPWSSLARRGGFFWSTLKLKSCSAIAARSSSVKGRVAHSRTLSGRTTRHIAQAISQTRKRGRWGRAWSSSAYAKTAASSRWRSA